MARLRLRLSHVFLRAFRIRRRKRHIDSMAIGNSSSSWRRNSSSINRNNLSYRSSSSSMAASGSCKNARGRSNIVSNKSLLLACNPCGSSSGSKGMVIEDYKFKIGSKGGGSSSHSEKHQYHSGTWEREKSWNIVTQMGDKVVSRKVVLKKKKRRAATALPAPFPHSSENFAQAAAFYEEASCSSSKYRLSTSSGDGNHWESGRFAWDRDLSFASGDELVMEEDMAMLDRLESCAKEVFSSFKASPVFQTSAEDKHFPSPNASQDEDEEADDEMEEGCQRRVRSMSKSPSPKQQMPKRGIYRGKAVVKESVDPFKDYMDSVIDMVEANHLRDAAQLEELRRCYFSLNPPEFHATIAMVFDELLLAW